MVCDSDPCQNSPVFKLASVSIIHGYTIMDLSDKTNVFENMWTGMVNYFRQNDGI